MKAWLSNNPVIGLTRQGGQYIITADTATTGLGAIQLQVNCKEETVVSFWSRTLRQHENNYTVHARNDSGMLCHGAFP